MWSSQDRSLPARRLAVVTTAALVVALVLAGPLGSASFPGGRSATGAAKGCAAAERLPKRPLRVGVVLGPAGLDDAYGTIVHRGLRRAVSRLGIVGRTLTAGPKENGSATYSYLARQGYDLLVGDASTALGLEAAAGQFPRTCFLSIDGGVETFPFRPPNVAGTVYRVEQAAYLAGYLAALVEQRRPGRHVVSSVGGAPVEPVDRFIAGFRAGARRADPHVGLLNGYTQDFLAAAKCRAVALHQIAEGSGVVFQVAGSCGLGALQAAREKHVWGIGVDTDESSLGPHVLTSVLKNVDVALFRAVRSLQTGTFRPGTNAVLSLKDGGVGLGRISPLVPRGLVARTERVRQQLVSGRLTAPATLR